MIQVSFGTIPGLYFNGFWHDFGMDFFANAWPGSQGADGRHHLNPKGGNPETIFQLGDFGGIGGYICNICKDFVLESSSDSRNRKPIRVFVKPLI